MRVVRAFGRGVIVLLVCALVGCMQLVVASAAAATTITISPSAVVVPAHVVVTWKTDASASTEVVWGPAAESSFADYPHASTFAALAGTSHSRTLNGVPIGVWHYRVRSVGAGGSEAVSADDTFTVTAAGSPMDDLVTDAGVTTMQEWNGTLYLGGAFTHILQRHAATATVDPVTGADADSGAAQVTGSVYASAPDGAGGEYIAGEFTNVGGLPRHNAAHILPDGGVDPDFDPNLNSFAYAVAASGGVVYLGGAFTTVNGGTARHYLAAVSATTGVATGWDAACDNWVKALVLSSGTLYVGGAFHNIGGGTHDYAAAVDTSTALASSWNPAVNDIVDALAVASGNVYLGGQFTSVNVAGTPTARNHAAAFDATTGVLEVWDPNLDNYVYTIAPSPADNRVYLGGSFSNANGGTSRPYAVAVNDSNGSLQNWSPTPDNQVRSIVLSGSSVYLGGSFTQVDGAARNRAAAVDATSGIVSAWDPNVNANVLTIDPSAGAGVYLGGDFTAIGAGMTRNRLAAIDEATGTLTSWNPDLDGNVNALAIANGTVYVGGNFASVNGGASGRHYAAAVDAITGAAAAFNPQPDSTVLAVAVAGGVVYLGGQFRHAGPDQTLHDFALAANASDGTLTAWNPDISNFVDALAVDNGVVYAGGSFTSVNVAGTPTARNHAAAFDATTGALATWDPNTNTSVQSIAVAGGVVYAGGGFTTVNGGVTSRAHAAAFNTSDGTLTSWNPGPNNSVLSLTVAGSAVYMGGYFSAAGGAARSGAAAVDTTAGLATSWNPAANGWVYDILPAGTVAYISGGAAGFSTVYLGAGPLMPVPTTPAAGEPVAQTPTLMATFTDPNPGDSGQLDFQLCADPACGSVLQSGSSAAGLGGGTASSWTTPGALTVGATYYWRVRGTDTNAVSSNYTAPRALSVPPPPDTTPPTIVPVFARMARLARVLRHGFLASVTLSEASSVRAMATIPWASALHLGLVRAPKRTHPKHPKFFIVGTGSGSASAGRETVKVTFTRAARRRFTRAKAIQHVTITLVATDMSGNVGMTSRRLTLTPPKAKPKQ